MSDVWEIVATLGTPLGSRIHVRSKVIPNEVGTLITTLLASMDGLTQEQLTLVSRLNSRLSGKEEDSSGAVPMTAFLETVRRAALPSSDPESGD